MTPDEPICPLCKTRRQRTERTRRGVLEVHETCRNHLCRNRGKKFTTLVTSERLTLLALMPEHESEDRAYREGQKREAAEKAEKEAAEKAAKKPAAIDIGQKWRMGGKEAIVIGVHWRRDQNDYVILFNVAEASTTRNDLLTNNEWEYLGLQERPESVQKNQVWFLRSTCRNKKTSSGVTYFPFVVDDTIIAGNGDVNVYFGSRKLGPTTETSNAMISNADWVYICHKSQFNPIIF